MAEEAEKDWLEPAGVNGIPYAFVVKDGRLLFGIHPAALGEDMIEALLEGGEREATEVAKILRAVDGKDEVEALMSEFTRQVASDPAAAAATLGKIREIDENHLMLGYLEVQLAMVHEDWPKVEQILEATENPTTAGAVAATLVDWPKEVPASVLTILVDKLLPQINGPDASPIEAFSLASLLWKLDRKEQATEVATQAAASFGAMMGDEFPQAALDAYVDSYKKGEPMSMQDLFILHAQMGQ